MIPLKLGTLVDDNFLSFFLSFFLFSLVILFLVFSKLDKTGHAYCPLVSCRFYLFLFLLSIKFLQLFESGPVIAMVL